MEHVIRAAGPRIVDGDHVRIVVEYPAAAI